MDAAQNAVLIAAPIQPDSPAAQQARALDNCIGIPLGAHLIGVVGDLGLDVIIPEQDLDESALQARLNANIDKVDRVVAILPTGGIFSGRQDLVALRTFETLNLLERLRSITNNHSNLFHCGPKGLVPFDLAEFVLDRIGGMSPTKGDANSAQVFLGKKPSGKISLMTPSALTSDDEAVKLEVKGHRQAPRGVKRLAATIRGYRDRKLTVYYDLPAVPYAPVLSNDVTAALRDVLQDDFDVWMGVISRCLHEVESHKNRLRSFISNLNSQKLTLLCNHGGGGYLKACAELVSQQADGVVALESHGMICPHGGGVRERAAAFLAKGRYNDLPDATKVVPRSRCQAVGIAPKKIKKVNRVCQIEALGKNVDGPFVVFYAPNFLPFLNCPPAVTTSCFETIDIADALADQLTDMKNITLNIRFKLTANDVARMKDLRKSGNKRISAENQSSLFARGTNVTDASFGAFSDWLEKADIVITEGVTAVMIDALEQRKPVLLLNKSPDRIPALPSTPVAKLDGTKRFAVYNASLDDDLPSALTMLKTLHKGKPLTDEELKDYCWV